MTPSTLLFLLTAIVAIASAQIHLEQDTWHVKNSMPFGEYTNATFPISITMPTGYFGYKVTVANGTADHWSNVFTATVGSYKKETVFTKEGTQTAVVSPCDIETSGGYYFSVHYGSAGATNSDNLVLDFELVSQQEASTISNDLEYWISPLNWVPENTTGSSPTAALLKFYELNVLSNTSFNAVNVQLDLVNKAGEPRRWADFFKTMTIGAYDEKCVISGEVIDLADDSTAESITRVSEAMAVSENDTIHMMLELADSSLWYTSDLEDTFAFKVTFTHTNVTPTSPKSSGIKAWQIALIVVGVVLVAVLIALLVFCCLRRRNYETIE